MPPQAAAVSQYGSAETLKIPGTAMLVGIFFIAFVLYYFVNWKYLSESLAAELEVTDTGLREISRLRPRIRSFCCC